MPYFSCFYNMFNQFQTKREEQESFTGRLSVSVESKEDAFGF